MKITYKQIRKAHPQPYEMSLVGDAARIVQKAVNIGIDSHLQACFVPDRGDKYTAKGYRLDCAVSCESLPVLLRRLTEMEYTGKDGDDNDIGGSLATAILNQIGIDVETGCYEITPD